jgi:hypothetical protein
MIVDKDNFHETILNFIEENGININNYDDTKEVYTKMLIQHYYFVLDRDLISDILVDITYILSPNNVNKGRVIETIDIEEDDIDD